MNLKSKLPKKIWTEMATAGAKVDILPGEDLVLVHEINYGNKAWKLYEIWAEKSNDPHVTATIQPSETISNSVLCPPEQLHGVIQREVKTLLSTQKTRFC